MERIAEKLRTLSAQMIDLGTDMSYYGGFSEMAKHGAELVGAGHVAAQWAEAIGAEEPPVSPGDGPR